jgi:LysR family transcriptional regulator, benzoate and cis,cis-muconate-responsive activator of ben and cat genes
VELRHLRYFTTVAAERSFSRAAEKLRVAQPPLSRQVQQLEDELGVRLLDRGRPITLTVAGRYLFENAQQLLQRVEEMRSMTRRLGKERMARLSIGFVASTLYDALPELIRRYRTTCPGVEIALTEMTTVEQIAALKDGRIDVAFGRLHFDDAGITRKVIREDHLIVALSCQHPLGRRGTAVKLREIVDEPLIVDYRNPRPSLAELVLSYFRQRGLSPTVGFEVRDLQTALGLVASGAGVSLVPSSARRLWRDDVAYLELDETKMVAPIIMSHRLSDKSAELSQLKKLIREFDQWHSQ